MFYMMLLLILLIGITFTLLGLPDQSGKQSPTSAHPVLSEGSSALLVGSVAQRGEDFSN